MLNYDNIGGPTVIIIYYYMLLYTGNWYIGIIVKTGTLLLFQKFLLVSRSLSNGLKFFFYFVVGKAVIIVISNFLCKVGNRTDEPLDRKWSFAPMGMGNSTGAAYRCVASF